MKKFTLNTFILSFFMLMSTYSFSQLLTEDFSGGTFPPTDWTILDDGESNWSAAETNNAGGEAPEARFNYAPSFVGISRLVTPVINSSSYSQLSVQFSLFLDDYGPADSYTLSVETTTDGGITWTEVTSMSNTGDDVGPEVVVAFITNDDVGSDQLQIAFTFNGDSYQLDNWYLDDVVVAEALNLDAMALELNIPTLIPASDIISPNAVVANNGIDTVTFDASLTISVAGGGATIYDEVLTTTELYPSESMNLIFPDWTSYVGTFDVVLHTSLTGDEDTSNDTLLLSIEALEGLIYLKPLFEEFTSATCGPCASANENLDPLLADNEETHSLIKYQVNWPGDGDPYYIEDCGTRKDYYNVGYAPLLNVNAVEEDPFVMDQATYDSFLGNTTAMEIAIVTAEIDENYMVTISADIDVIADYAAGLTAHIAVLEKLTVGNVMGNGETEFNNVLMKMLPDADGTTLSALTEGTTVTITETYDMSTTFMEGPNDLTVVIFVQDDTDKTLIQTTNADIAGEFDTYTLSFNVVDSDGNAVDGAEIFLEANGTQYTNSLGQATYPGVFDGSYTYDVSAVNLFSNSGTVEIIGNNVTEDVVLDIPTFFYFESFDEDIPDDWTLYAAGWDYLYWYDGVVIFFRQSGTLDPLMLVTAAIDVSTADSLYFALGDQSNNPPVLFGTVTDPSDASTFVELEEIVLPEEGWEEYVFDISTLAGDLTEVYFAWKHNTSETSFFSLDYLIITEPAVNNSVKELEGFETLLYPNPTSDLVTIESELQINSIAIFSASGQLIETIQMNSKTIQINVSDYTPGIYLFQMATERGEFTKSITVE